jgi:hypothetical protein
MNESAKFEAQKKKLQGLCDEHHLVYSLERNNYPVTLTLRPTGELGGQMVMPEMAEEDSRSPDATLVFSIEDGELDIKTSETFTISSSLFKKLENIFKKMYSFWTQFFFRDVIERQLLTTDQIPVVEESYDNDGYGDDDDYDAEPSMTTTVDSSGLVTHVEFSSDNDDDDDDAYDYDDPDDPDDLDTDDE